MFLPFTVAVDFDGTLCENAWPNIGAPKMDMINYLISQQRTGWKLILWTCRSGAQLDEAVRWCKTHGLVFDAVNKNLPERVKHFGDDPRKIGADAYLDDHNAFIHRISEKPQILYP